MREVMSVYTEEIALLNVLPTFPVVPSAPTGGNVTEEAAPDDNQTAVNVTSPELNSFYFYEVSRYFVNAFASALAIISESTSPFVHHFVSHSTRPSLTQYIHSAFYEMICQ
jgi:hypothetical protein